PPVPSFASPASTSSATSTAASTETMTTLSTVFEPLSEEDEEDIANIAAPSVSTAPSNAPSTSDNTTMMMLDPVSSAISTMDTDPAEDSAAAAAFSDKAAVFDDPTPSQPCTLSQLVMQ
ncbi:hypothetical protein TrRE_jg4005, partial [Triparma retinervis]